MGFSANGAGGSKSYPGAIGVYSMGPQGKATIRGNTFTNNSAKAYAKAHYLKFNGEVSYLNRNKFADNTVGSVHQVLCVYNIESATRRAPLSISGSKGLSPAKRSSNKTGPW